MQTDYKFTLSERVDTVQSSGYEITSKGEALLLLAVVVFRELSHSLLLAADVSAPLDIRKRIKC